MKRKIKQKIKETLALPAEVIMDSPKIVLEANYNVWIENYVGIIESVSYTHLVCAER